jgi:hypothetical protein
MFGNGYKAVRATLLLVHVLWCKIFVLYISIVLYTFVFNFYEKFLNAMYISPLYCIHSFSIFMKKSSMQCEFILLFNLRVQRHVSTYEYICDLVLLFLCRKGVQGLLCSRTVALAESTSSRREFGGGVTNGFGYGGVLRREGGEGKASEKGHGLRQPYCGGGWLS